MCRSGSARLVLRGPAYRKKIAYIILRLDLRIDEPNFPQASAPTKQQATGTPIQSSLCKKYNSTLMRDLFLTFYSSKHHNGLYYAAFRGVKSELWNYIYLLARSWCTTGASRKDHWYLTGCNSLVCMLFPALQITSNVEQRISSPDHLSRYELHLHLRPADKLTYCRIYSQRASTIVHQVRANGLPFV